MQCGLNHIPLQPTWFAEIYRELDSAWCQAAQLLDLTSDITRNGSSWLRQRAHAILSTEAKANRNGHRVSTQHTLPENGLDELRYLSEHLFMTGLDKASNNISFICILHLRHMALERLQGDDFIRSDRPLEEIIVDLDTEIQNLIPEIRFCTMGLPFIMASYKLHKLTYRWITSAANCLFSGVASIITQILKLLIEEIREWGAQRTHAIHLVTRVKHNFIWMIDSVFEFVLNLPQEIYSMFVVDITQCYERIPLTEEDNLPEALSFITRKAFQHHSSKSKTQVCWVHINTNSGLADKAIWCHKRPGTTCWIEFTESWFIHLQNWLIQHCFIRLGDGVWRQQLGIPMGFSCSPLWCNLYFMAYVIRFLLLMASLNRYDLLQHFRFSFRYIDDLCILNNELIQLL